MLSIVLRVRWFSAGGVLTEEIPGRSDQVLVTVAWFGKEKAYFFSDLVYGFEQMDKVEELPLSIKTCQVSKDLRTLYNFYVHPSAPKAGLRLVADPLNPNKFIYPPGFYMDEDDNSVNPTEIISSELVLKEAPAQPWLQEQVSVPKGVLYPGTIKSLILGGQRPLWVYLPPGYASLDACKVLILLDGKSYLEVMHATTTLDNLLAEKRIPPTVTVFIDNSDLDQRNLELPCYPPFVAFLTEELMPWIRTNYSVSKLSKDVVIGGFSYGGLAALFAASQRSDVFGNVLSQSGAFWWKPSDASTPAWLYSYLSKAPRLPLRIYLDAGKLEDKEYDEYPCILRINRLLRAELQRKGYLLHYREFNGGHDYFNWQGTLADGLQFLLNPVVSEHRIQDCGVEIFSR